MNADMIFGVRPDVGGALRVRASHDQPCDRPSIQMSSKK